jgi:glycosyltransferase involved in cell wall biosynthesis
MESAKQLRVVLVHDWLTGMRGGEKCLEVLCRRFPRAPLFNILHCRGSVSPDIERLWSRSSFLQRFPGVERYYRYLLPLMPLAARWKIPPCDVVVSLSHCVAKSACPPPGVPHVCYCLTPMRYAWHLRSSYVDDTARRSSIAALGGWVQDKLLDALRDWDHGTAGRVTHFLAVSRTVQRRIADCYGRYSRVLYPPVDTDFFCPARVPRDDFYLVLSALVPYKRLDLAVSACNRLGRRLLVVGSGPESARLRSLAGPSVHFLGWQSASAVRDHLRRCRALLFPGEEDFGIVPVEAQACGTPVIAYGKGGATETVIPLNGAELFAGFGHAATEPTGVWFAEQSAACLAEAIAEFERHQRDFDPAATRRQSLRFDLARFAQEIFSFLDEVAGKNEAAARESITVGSSSLTPASATQSCTDSGSGP